MLLPVKTVTFDFPGCEGFKVDLAFLSKESNQAIFKKCQVQKFETKTRKPETEFDISSFQYLFSLTWYSLSDNCRTRTMSQFHSTSFILMNGRGACTATLNGPIVITIFKTGIVECPAITSKVLLIQCYGISS